jgi:hypothetical protein
MKKALWNHTRNPKLPRVPVYAYAKRLLGGGGISFPNGTRLYALTQEEMHQAARHGHLGTYLSRPKDLWWEWRKPQQKSAKQLMEDHTYEL